MPEEETVWIVSTCCKSTDQGSIARAAEVLSRAIVGIAFEQNIECSLIVRKDFDDDEDEDLEEA